MSAQNCPPSNSLRVGNSAGKVIVGIGPVSYGFDPPEALALASLLIRHASEIWAQRSMVEKALQKSPVDTPSQS